MAETGTSPRRRPGDRGLRSLIAALLLSLALFGLWEVLDASLLGDGSFDLPRVLRGAVSALLVAAVVILLTLRSRRRQETMRERARQHLEGLMRSSPEAIVTTDTRGRITYASRAACKLTGRSEEELVGRRTAEIYADGKAEAARLLRILRKEGEVRDRLVEVRRGDGGAHSILLSVSLLEGADGSPLGTLGIGRSVPSPTNGAATDRETESLAAIRQLSASVAHEVRNPLAGIRGAMQVLRSDPDRSPVESAVMGEILTQIHRLEVMVQDLVDFASPIAAHPRPVDAANLVEGALGLVRRAPAMAGVTVEVDVDDSPGVLADENLMHRALRIVLENAAHAAAGRGTVRIDTRSEDGTVVLLVRDSGPGIRAEHRDDVFRPFFTTKHRGSGLGLAIARRIMEAHGGTIDFDCPPDGGTVFRLGLPAIPARIRRATGGSPPVGINP